MNLAEPFYKVEMQMERTSKFAKNLKKKCPCGRVVMGLFHEKPRSALLGLIRIALFIFFNHRQVGIITTEPEGHEVVVL